MLRDLVREGRTLLLRAQYLEEADQLADDLVVIDHGRTVAQGDSIRAEGPSWLPRLVIAMSPADQVAQAVDLINWPSPLRSRPWPAP